MRLRTLAAALLAGCGGPSLLGRAAEPAAGDTYLPWAAPGRRVGTASRGYGWFSTQGAGRYTVYVDARGRRFEAHEAVYPAFAWLERRGGMAGWPVAHEEAETVLASDGVSSASTGRTRRLRRAPYAFAVVAVHPTVVLMSPPPPDDALVPPAPPPDAPAATRARYEAAAAGVEVPQLRYQRASFVTSVEAAGPLLWFSPELDRLPAPVRMTAPGRGEVPLPDGRLVLTRANGAWDVVRE